MEDKQGSGHYSPALSSLLDMIKKRKRLWSWQLVHCLPGTKKRIREMAEALEHNQTLTLPVILFGNAFRKIVLRAIIG